MGFSVALPRVISANRLLWAIHADKWPLISWLLLIGLSVLTGQSLSVFSGFEHNPVMPLTDTMLFFSWICLFGWRVLVPLPLCCYILWKFVPMSEKAAANWASGWRILHLLSLFLLAMLGTVIVFGYAHYGPAFFSPGQSDSQNRTEYPAAGYD